MALDALRCNHLARLGFKGLKLIVCDTCMFVILVVLCLLVKFQCGCHRSQLKATYLLTYLLVNRGTSETKIIRLQLQQTSGNSRFFRVVLRTAVSHCDGWSVNMCALTVADSSQKLQTAVKRTFSCIFTINK